jgi:hypothetical protein
MPEKKRFSISPLALTQGDIQQSAPYISAYFANQGLTYTQGPLAVSQIYCASASTATPAWSCWDASPYPLSSPGYKQRVGASITMTSAHHKFQCWAQSNLNTNFRYKLVYFIPKIPLQTSSLVATFVNAMFLTSAFPSGSGLNGGNGIIDFNSELDPDYREQYTMLRTVKRKFSADNFNSQTMVSDFSVGFKFPKGHHIRFNQDNTYITSGQIMCLVLCDSGNIGSAAYTGVGSNTLPITNYQTGMYMNFNMTNYYYDV